MKIRKRKAVFKVEFEVYSSSPEDHGRMLEFLELMLITTKTQTMAYRTTGIDSLARVIRVRRMAR
jgi:hypothetical protein